MENTATDMKKEEVSIDLVPLNGESPSKLTEDSFLTADGGEDVQRESAQMRFDALPFDPSITENLPSENKEVPSQEKSSADEFRDKLNKQILVMKA
jgi:hypothetical protein